MIGRIGAVVGLAVALLLPAAPASAASAHAARSAGFCQDIMLLRSNSRGGGAAKGHRFDTAIKLVEKQAPSKIKADLEQIRKYFAKFVVAKTDKDSAAVTKLVSSPKFEAAGKEADAWMQPYLKKKCGISVNTTTTAG